MILKYRGLDFELSTYDYAAWLSHFDLDRLEDAEVGKHRGYEILPGRCPFCKVFEIRVNIYEHSCPKCPLKIFGVHEGQHRVDGCVNLMVDILGDPERVSGGAPELWGLIFMNYGTYVIGDKGKESIKKIISVIEKSVIDNTDREGLKTYFESAKEIKNIEKAESFERFIENQRKRKG